MIELEATAPSLVEDLNRAISKIAEKHSLGFSGVNAAHHDGALFVHFAIHGDEPCGNYARWYLGKAAELCLEPTWLGAAFEMPESNERFTVIGLDPDGGKTCIRIKSDAGREGFITPSGLRSVMASIP